MPLMSVCLYVAESESKLPIHLRHDDEFFDEFSDEYDDDTFVESMLARVPKVYVNPHAWTSSLHSTNASSSICGKIIFHPQLPCSA